jgi:hypothetical protein
MQTSTGLTLLWHRGATLPKRDGGKLHIAHPHAAQHGACAAYIADARRATRDDAANASWCKACLRFGRSYERERR